MLFTPLTVVTLFANQVNAVKIMNPSDGDTPFVVEDSNLLIYDWYVVPRKHSKKFYINKCFSIIVNRYCGS